MRHLPGRAIPGPARAALLAPALIISVLLVSCAELTGPTREAGGRPMAGDPAGSIGNTRLAIYGRQFKINGALTYRGKAAEGLLMNVRMVNSVFEDVNRPSFNPAVNTDEFVNRMRDYVALGVRAFTVSLQGGYPGYEGAWNSAFLKNGDLKSTYLARVAKVIERADAVGAVIILSLFYQRQDQYLQDERAVRAGVVNAVNWIRNKGYKNVILEIANEYGHSGFDHGVLRSDAGVADLIRLAKSRHSTLPVSASHLRNGHTSSRVGAASDLILVHFNNLALSEIPARVRALRDAFPNKPIVCNEDSRTGSAAASAASASVKAGASYGLMVERRNQHYDFDFHGRSDDPAAYDRYVALTR
jgi:hypothetical protein